MGKRTLAASTMALVSGEPSFLLVRFLLGAAEAGLFPGMLLYLTYWFPSAYRARVNAALVLAIPASGAVGAPIATSLLELNGAFGLAGWQWMFLLEGLPTVVLGLVVVSISCFANFGGIIGPIVIGWLKTTTNSFSGGLYYVAGSAFVASVAILLLRTAPRAVKVGAAVR